MQKSLIAVIADRYRQQDFDALTSKDDLKPADIRRICFDLGIALIISALFQKGCILILFPIRREQSRYTGSATVVQSSPW